MVIFVICLILGCDLFPIITPKGISMVIRTSLFFFLDQFMAILYDRYFGSEVQSYLKLTIPQIRVLSTIWLTLST